MSKRIIAMLLALTLVAACLPVGVLAEEASAQHTCEHCQQVPEWVSWDGTTALESGKHYVLASDVTPGAAIALTEGSYVLCLNGHTISGATAGRIFDLSGTASLTILDHTATGQGAAYTAGSLTGATNTAVAVSGNASFTMYDGIMENNKRPTGKDGGCIFLQGEGSVSLLGGLYRNNFARYGAVVYMVGNRADQLRVNLQLENAYITGNTSTHTGAIQGDGLSTIRVQDTVITGNSTTGVLTGGMYVTSAEGEVTLSGKVVIDGNTNKTADSINRNLVLNNAAIKLNLDGLTQGSRIQLKSANTDPKVAITTTENQKAWNCGWVTLGNDSVSWTDSDADGLVAASELTAGHYHNGVKYTAVTGNAVLPTTGGNFYLTQDVKLAGVAALGANINLCLNGHNVYAAKNARILQLTKNTGAVVSIEDCTAYTDAEGVYQAGGLTGASTTSFGPVYVNAGTTLKLYGGKITGNTASAAAGVYNTGTFYMYGGEISNNHATKANSGCHGGGVYNAGAFTMEGGTICNNEAKNYGGGIFSNKAATISGGIISGNTAAQGGGIGLYNKNTFAIGAVTVTGNTATTEGGGLWLSNGATATVTDAVITGNTAPAGAGAAIRQSTLTMKSGKIADNTCSNTGGGVFVNGDGAVFTLENGEISGNTAKFGGGIMIMTKGSQAIVKGGTIEKNESSAQGGGVYASTNTQFTLEGGSISQNTAARNGGGIYNLAATVTMTGGTIENNVSKEHGGGIGMKADVVATYNLQGGKITGNSAVEGGGIQANELAVLNISGGLQVIGNTDESKASNLNLVGESLLIHVGEMTEGAKVSVSGVPFRAISAPVATDCSSAFASDSALYAVKYVEGALHLDVAVEHNHCLCGGASATGCDHAQLKFAPWESTTSLPTSGTYYLINDVVLSGQTRLENTELTLCLNGHTVKVAETGRVFYLAGNVTLNLTDCAGSGKLTGATIGAILTNASGKDMEVNLYGGKITENHSTDSGGAVVLQGGTVLNMYGGEISKNSAPEGKHGGAIFVLGGAQFNQLGGTISGNTAGATGGAIYANKGVLELQGGTISGNSATKDGGGILLNRSTAVVSGTSIESNSAVDGGGISVTEASLLTMTGGKITGNQVTQTGGGIFVKGEGSSAVISGGQVSYNSAKYGGGIITQTKSVLTIKGGAVTQNSATSNGGGVYISTNTTLNMEGGEISKNKSSLNGGGIYFLNSNLNMTGGKVSGNTAKADGGGMYMQLSNSLFKGGSVTGNSAKNAGGIRMTGGKHRISGLTVSYNTAQADGGGIQIGRQMVKVNGANVDKMPDFVMYSGTFVGNKAKNGAGLLLLSKGAQYTIQNAYIAENNASSGGGGIYVSTGATLNMYGGTVTKNYGRTGGGIMMLASAGNYENVEISENTGNNAPALMINKPIENASVHAKSMKILNNAGSASGAIVVQGGALLYMDDSLVKGNSTEKTGGAIFTTTRAESYIKNTTFEGNYAGVDAGAVMLGLNSVCELDGCTVSSNSATGNGGGIYNRGLMRISNTKVLNNTCGNNGAGIGSGRTGSTHTGSKCGLYIENVISSGNKAEGNGGGLFGSLGCHVVATDLTLTDNEAKGNGGGAWAQEDFIVENLTATGNAASIGAVYLAASHYDGQSYFTGVMKFSGKVVIQDNQGGGLFVGERTTLTLEGKGLETGSYMDVTLHSGLLTQKVFGVYDYEGSDLVYVVTPGERSVTDPEHLKEPEAETTDQEAAATDIILYVGIGLFAAAVIAVAVLLGLKKKKAGNAAEKASKE